VSVFDAAKVEAFLVPLRADPVGALGFAAVLAGGTLVPIRALAANAAFAHLSAWERANVLWGLRDALDVHLRRMAVGATDVARLADDAEDGR